MDNAIREIRWDPGENANVTINDVVVTVTCEMILRKIFYRRCNNKWNRFRKSYCICYSGSTGDNFVRW